MFYYIVKLTLIVDFSKFYVRLTTGTYWVKRNNCVFFFLFRLKANELKKLICEYEGNVKTCNKMIAKQNKLSDNLVDLCQKIGVI